MTYASDLLVGKKAQVQIGEVSVDASISESHSIEGEITSHPVESGSDITDHYRVNPREISLEAVVTSTPIATGYPAQTAINSVKSIIAKDDPVMNAWQEVERYFEKRIIITINTSLKKYKNMILTSFNVTRNSAKGQSLHFSLTAREIRVVSTVEKARITVPEPKPKKKTVEKKKDKGKKDKKKPTDAESEGFARKAGRKILEGLGNFLGA